MLDKTGTIIRSLSVPVAKVNFGLLLILAFSLSLSTSVVSGAAVLLVLGFFLEGGLADKVKEALHNPVCQALFFYLGLMVVGLFWTDDAEKGLSFLLDRWKLMLMPIFLGCITFEKRWWYLAAFIAGICAVMITTYLAWFDLIHFSDVSPEHLTRKTSHVYYNPLLAFAIYVLAQVVIWGKVKKKFRISGGLLLAVMVVNMFITEGRCGQLVFFVLLAMLLLRLFRRKMMLAVGVISITLPLIFMTGYTLSPTFNARVNQAYDEMISYKENPKTSVGRRLLYWRNSLEIMKGAPWIGVGTGDFEAAYIKVNQKFSPTVTPTDNPHNHYFMVATRLGLPGLIALFTIFIVQLQQAWCLNDDLRWLRFAFPVFYLVIMLTESYLKVHATAFFFSMFSAVLFKMPCPHKKSHSSIVTGIDRN